LQKWLYWWELTHQQVNIKQGYKMKHFFYRKERKKGSSTIKYFICRIYKNCPYQILTLKVSGKAYAGDLREICKALVKLKEITAGQCERHLASSVEDRAEFKLYQIPE